MKMQSYSKRDKETAECGNNAYVAFYVDESLYGIDVMKVMEIIRMQEIKPVSGVPEYIKGVIDLRGTSVPVVDLRVRFNSDNKSSAPGSLIVIADVNGKPVGMAADSVLDVIRTGSEEDDYCEDEMERKILRAIREDDKKLILIEDSELIM